MTNTNGGKALKTALGLLGEKRGRFVSVRFGRKVSDQVIRDLTPHKSGKMRLTLACGLKESGLLLHEGNVKVSRCLGYICITIFGGDVHIELNPKEARIH